MTAADARLEALWPEVLALADRARRVRAQGAGGGGDADAFGTALADLGRRAAGSLIAALYLPLVAAIARGPVTIGQIGQSLDGRIATASGHSHYINGAAGLDHLHRLRALADCVVVGAGSVAADDPRLTTRRVAGPNPVRVVLDPSRRLSPTHRVFDAAAPTVTVVAAGATAAAEQPAVIALEAEGDRLPPAAILAALAARGLHTVLIEGGAHTLSGFLAAGAIDRLHVLVAPLIIGSGPFGLRLPPVARIADALRLEIAVHRLGDDVLIEGAPRRAPAK